MLSVSRGSHSTPARVGQGGSGAGWARSYASFQTPSVTSSANAATHNWAPPA
ncbi:hypothetical protein ACIBJC_12615 [Streptomyces sp. NPDC050509]|uniref:hypothetical protein n=1 Tax=Streptomyces sp. NPDC050509 TaxID=3365620 RepID=UPI00378D1D57